MKYLFNSFTVVRFLEEQAASRANYIIDSRHQSPGMPHQPSTCVNRRVKETPALKRWASTTGVDIGLTVARIALAETHERQRGRTHDQLREGMSQRRRVWVEAEPLWLPGAGAGAGACPYIRLVLRRRWRLVGSKA